MFMSSFIRKTRTQENPDFLGNREWGRREGRKEREKTGKRKYIKYIQENIYVADDIFEDSHYTIPIGGISTESGSSYWCPRHSTSNAPVHLSKAKIETLQFTHSPPPFLLNQTARAFFYPVSLESISVTYKTRSPMLQTLQYLSETVG